MNRSTWICIALFSLTLGVLAARAAEAQEVTAEPAADEAAPAVSADASSETTDPDKTTETPAADPPPVLEPAPKTAIATFAGGCFWCMEPPFDALDGVVATTSGYTGGDVKDPTYEQVSKEETGHYEAVQITYDPDKISYAELLAVFWRNVDPLDADGQFCDRGSSYRTAIFFYGPEQEAEARQSATAIAERLGNDLATALLAAVDFYPAEEYHQNYYEKNPIRYKFYRAACGRDRRLKELWGG